MIWLFKDRGELQIMVIPVVISRVGKRRAVTAADLAIISSAKEIRMENRIMYPPIRVMVSKPFMIQVSRESLPFTERVSWEVIYTPCTGIW